MVLLFFSNGVALYFKIRIFAEGWFRNCIAYQVSWCYCTAHQVTVLLIKLLGATVLLIKLLGATVLLIKLAGAVGFFLACEDFGGMFNI